MENYLGEIDVDIADTEYANYTKEDWVLYWIFAYGQIDGAHHKQWVLDQIVQILKDTPIIIKKAQWGTPEDIKHEEFRITLGEPGVEYYKWVREYEYDEEGEHYTYEIGIAP